MGLEPLFRTPFPRKDGHPRRPETIRLADEERTMNPAVSRDAVDWVAPSSGDLKALSPGKRTASAA